MTVDKWVAQAKDCCGVGCDREGERRRETSFPPRSPAEVRLVRLGPSSRRWCFVRRAILALAICALVASVIAPMTAAQGAGRGGLGVLAGGDSVDTRWCGRQGRGATGRKLRADVRLPALFDHGVSTGKIRVRCEVLLDEAERPGDVREAHGSASVLQLQHECVGEHGSAHG